MTGRVEAVIMGRIVEDTVTAWRWAESPGKGLVSWPGKIGGLSPIHEVRRNQRAWDGTE